MRLYFSVFCGRYVFLKFWLFLQWMFYSIYPKEGFVKKSIFFRLHNTLLWRNVNIFMIIISNKLNNSWGWMLKDVVLIFWAYILVFQDRSDRGCTRTEKYYRDHIILNFNIKFFTDIVMIGPKFTLYDCDM